MTTLDAMKQAVNLLGPTAPECSGCAHEWNAALTILEEAIASMEAQPEYTTGHCKEMQHRDGCQLHNLQCGYPSCDRKAAEMLEAAPRLDPRNKP